jgi:SAM-dependent methyltransferase
VNPILSKLWRKLAGRFAYLPYVYSKTEWDKQYQTGRWDFLDGVAELAHHSVIAGYVKRFGLEKSVLDVCSGAGTLQGVLGEESYKYYLGVDISEEAIARTGSRQSSKTFFACADITRFTPDRSFDVIIFNECFYYLQDPLDTLSWYSKHLNDDGVFVVSMYVEIQTRHIWNMLDALYLVEDEARVTNKAGTSWIVKVLRRNPPLAAVGSKVPAR